MGYQSLEGAETVWLVRELRPGPRGRDMTPRAGQAAAVGPGPGRRAQEGLQQTQGVAGVCPSGPLLQVFILPSAA